MLTLQIGAAGENRRNQAVNSSDFEVGAILGIGTGVPIVPMALRSARDAMPVLVVGVEEVRTDRTGRGAGPRRIHDAAGRRAFSTPATCSPRSSRDALVTDVHLGDYNGLHLVAIAQVEHPRTTCLVVGPARSRAAGGVLPSRGPISGRAGRRRPGRLGAGRTGGHPRPQRRWPRKRPAREVADVRLGDRSAHRRRQLRRRRHRVLRRRPARRDPAADGAGDRHDRPGRTGLGAAHRPRPSRCRAGWPCAATAPWTPSGARSSTRSNCCRAILPLVQRPQSRRAVVSDTGPLRPSVANRRAVRKVRGSK